MGNAVTYNRLARCGLRPAAESYKEEVRLRRKAAGDDRATASRTAEDAMWEVFKPALERAEKQQDRAGVDPPLTGCTDDLNQFLDPDYHETDPGKWLRDGLIWTAAEIRRVVIDSDEGTKVDLARASTKPPTAWAVFVLEAFARKPPDKRGELIGRVMPFATRTHEEEGGTEGKDAAEHNGFLDSM